MQELSGLPRVVGVDTGGTFTDMVIVEESGSIRVDKLPSFPSDPAQPVLEGLSSLPAGTSCRVVHGTTVATNALLEHNLAVTALITTCGFEDVLEIGRQNRPDLYQIHPQKPPALIPRRLRVGVEERVLHDGTIRIPLDRAQVKGVLEELDRKGVKAVAVCFLHSYANPVHEQIVGEMARSMGFTVSLSSKVLPEFREYERTATVALNACLRPVMESYLARLQSGMNKQPLSVMQSAGGIIPAAIAGRLPVHTVLSGPAGGVIAAGEKAETVGIDRIITFDMGGTSTDVSLYNGVPSLTSDMIIAGHPVRVPAIDIHTVGAGGGSIAFRDPGGSLKVGPRSAGARPGPVCYGYGDEVTVTDANLFLGRLQPSSFLGGRMKIRPDRVIEPMQVLADSLGLEPVRTAEGIIRVANAVMERAIRVISVEKGHDPRDFTLVGFGGAGGLHAVELARSLRIPRILIPGDAGVLSAYGLAVADVTRDFSRTLLRKVGNGLLEDLEPVFEDIILEGTEELAREGIERASLKALKFLDLRYAGQSYELTLPVTDDPIGAFHQSHGKLYGYSREQSEVELVNVRVRLFASTPKPDLVRSPLVDKDASQALLGVSGLIFQDKEFQASLYDREKLQPGNSFAGPALVLEQFSTTLLLPGSFGHLDECGNILIAP
jgi:N-methylhydantoinase A